MPTYYATLHVHSDATIDDVKKSFRALAKEFHPDINKNPNAHNLFCEIYAAYEILSDPAKRKKYDAYLDDVAKPKSPSNIRDEEMENRRWQSAAESQGRAYASMPYEKFAEKVFVVAAYGCATYMVGFAILWVVMAVAGLFIAPRASIALWVPLILWAIIYAKDKIK